MSGMLANQKLAMAISDMGFYEFRRQLDYKCQLYGSKLVVVDRFYPSSKTCSNCGAVKEFLSLSERVFHCDVCQFEGDRDLNASIKKGEGSSRDCESLWTGSADASRVKQEKDVSNC